MYFTLDDLRLSKVPVWRIINNMNPKTLNFQKPHNNIVGPCLDKPAEIRCTSCIMDTSYYSMN
jgi:hypothetical protein